MQEVVEEPVLLVVVGPVLLVVMEHVLLVVVVGNWSCLTRHICRYEIIDNQLAVAAKETNLNPLLLFFLFGLNFISNEYLLPIFVEDDRLSGK